jgi:hypothetical protein
MRLPRRRRAIVEALRLANKRPQRQHQLPAARPHANGASSRVPPVLHGCCYNCGEEGHIASQCDNPTMCVRCSGTEHIVPQAALQLLRRASTTRSRPPSASGYRGWGGRSRPRRNATATARVLGFRVFLARRGC